MCTDITTRKGKLTITVIDKDKGKEGIFPLHLYRYIITRKGQIDKIPNNSKVITFTIYQTDNDRTKDNMSPPVGNET